MGARVIQLAEFRTSRSMQAQDAAHSQLLDELGDRFFFWTGSSGRRYVHTVYSLIDCPELPAGNFMLICREPQGRRTVLAIGQLVEYAASLNLAELRRRGARLGANEVHVHLLAETAHERRLIELDLRAGQELLAGDGQISAVRH